MNPLPRIEIVSLLNSPENSRFPLDAPDLRLRRVEEFLQASNLAVNSQRAYRAELERFVAWSDKAWSEVTARDLARFKQMLKTEGVTKAGTGLAPASINQAITALKSFYRWFEQAGYWQGAAVLPTAGLKFEKLAQPLPRHLEGQQLAAIEQVLAVGEEPIQLRNRALLAILTHGLRASDVSALNVGNFDGVRLRFIRGKDKTESSVPLRMVAREQIQAYLAWRSEQVELTLDAPLLLSHDFRTAGQRLGYAGIYYFTKQVGRSVGIADLTPHRFRHTYASALVELGIDTLLARTLTGHKSERVFERYVMGKRSQAAETAFLMAIGEEPHPIKSRLLQKL